MEAQPKPRKVRWNIASTMAIVCNTLRKSKLNIKQTQNYITAMERLTSLYNLSKIQVWILCLSCERAIDKNDYCSIRDIAVILNVSAMLILQWRNELFRLEKKGFIER